MPAMDSWGGPALSEPPFVAALRKLGVDVTEETYVYGDKNKPTPFTTRVRRVIATALRFRRVIKQNDFNLIHLNTALDLKTLVRDTISIRLMKPKKAKVFLKIHGSEAKILTSKNPFIVFLLNRLKENVNGFGIHTSEEKQNFVQAGFPQEKLFFDKNAVTIFDRLPVRTEPETWLKRPQDKFNLLFVSRFVPAKGLIETIKAAAIVRNSNFNFTLHCLGDGETRAEAEKLTDQLNLQNFVHFTGYVSETEVAKYLSNGDLLIFPTFHPEGFPNILFNAMAAGLPVVTTKIRAAADYLREPENCLWIEPKNPKMLAGKICELLENAELRRTMCENNRAFGKRLTPENIAHEFLAIYQTLLGQN
jgi:glycosyltransferase involved in cell wall biosynthesis